MTVRTALFLGCAALLAALSAGCETKCSSLSDTCDKCVDDELKATCEATVNAGNSDACDSENQQLAGVCR